MNALTFYHYKQLNGYKDGKNSPSDDFATRSRSRI